MLSMGITMWLRVIMGRSITSMLVVGLLVGILVLVIGVISSILVQVIGVFLVPGLMMIGTLVLVMGRVH